MSRKGFQDPESGRAKSWRSLRQKPPQLPGVKSKPGDRSNQRLTLGSGQFGKITYCFLLLSMGKVWHLLGTAGLKDFQVRGVTPQHWVHCRFLGVSLGQPNSGECQFLLQSCKRKPHAFPRGILQRRSEFQQAPLLWICKTYADRHRLELVVYAISSWSDFVFVHPQGPNPRTAPLTGLEDKIPLDGTAGSKPRNKKNHG